MDLAVLPETKCQGLFSTPTIHCMKKSHCRFLHNGSKVIFYSLLITGKLVPKLKFSHAFSHNKSLKTIWQTSNNLLEEIFRINCLTPFSNTYLEYHTIYILIVLLHKDDKPPLIQFREILLQS